VKISRVVKRISHISVQISKRLPLRRVGLWRNNFDYPYGEHDFGSFELCGRKFIFKMDYYDPEKRFASEDPSDPAKTVRVLTLMLGSDY